MTFTVSHESNLCFQYDGENHYSGLQGLTAHVLLHCRGGRGESLDHTGQYRAGVHEKSLTLNSNSNIITIIKGLKTKFKFKLKLKLKFKFKLKLKYNTFS